MAACALINHPSLILADEPTNDLDDVWAGEIIQMFIEAVKEGSAIVMATHNNIWAAEATALYRMEHEKLALLDK